MGLFTFMCPVPCALAFAMVPGGLTGPSHMTRADFMCSLSIPMSPWSLHTLDLGISLTILPPDLSELLDELGDFRRELVGRVPTWTSSTLIPHWVMLSFYHSGAEMIWQAGRWRLGKCPSFRTLLSGVEMLNLKDHGHLSGDWSGDKYTSYVNWKMNGMNG